GEGGAILVLKPLQKAEEDQDHIYAVIKGVGTNHGGKTNSLTVTNPKAQAELIAGVYEKAGVSPDTVSYIEAHGPGTPLGDPIEILGLKTAFSQLYKKYKKKPKKATCGLGSVKTNIGHLEAAAGIAGVVKVAASLKHNLLPATIHFKQLNPVIRLKERPFYIVNKTTPWELPKFNNRPPSPRRAGVSSFGFGGSNAHVILEEYIPRQEPGLSELSSPAPSAPATTGDPVPVPLSARTAE
ncbi:MAG: polyketide synthase, partial [bacterium]|nr:polyketide synthase [bacterium]